MSYLTEEPLLAQPLVEQVLRGSDGAVATFIGVVRDNHRGRQVESILYEAYHEMAEREIGRIVDQLRLDFPDASIAVRHRLGRLSVGEASIIIAVAAPHRAEAFSACREVIDRIKMTVPIWKKERSPAGDEWVGWQWS
jgi:molybdopterin synthase catalytic subunit